MGTARERRIQIRQTISASIRAERGRAGYSQSDLAEAIGVSQKTVSGWERGTSMMGLDRAWQVAETLGVDIDQLAGKPVRADDERR